MNRDDFNPMNYSEQDDLLFLPLGGSGEIGMNLNLYCCDGQWLMVDLGLTFAGEYFPGIDLILPDPGFIEERREDLLAIVLTHGHEDHIGAVAHLWRRLRVPLYATPFTAELVRGKLAEQGLEKEAELNIVENGGSVQIGPYDIRYIPLAHSIAEGNGLKITTRHGVIFHTGDWKLDPEPLVGEPTPGVELAKLGDEGVLAMIGDSTNVFNEEASGSEKAVRDSLTEIVAEMENRVVISTFASNVARLDTIGHVAKTTGRSLVAVGRSMKRVIEASKKVGYLQDFPPLLDEDEAAKCPRSELLILCTGCQGEGRAALARIARGDHPRLKLVADDHVILSSKIIPGNELAIGRLVNSLVLQNIHVITEKDAFVHVSGHPGQPELRDMYSWIRPRIAIPVHGEARHMARHAELAREQGVEKVITVMNGDIVRLASAKSNAEPGKVDEVPVGRLVVDGQTVLPIASETIAERRRMMMSGHVSITIALDREGGLVGEPQLVARGIPGWHEGEAMHDRLLDVVEGTLDKLKPAQAEDDHKAGEAVRIAARRALDYEIGKRPVTDVRVIRLDNW